MRYIGTILIIYLLTSCGSMKKNRSEKELVVDTSHITSEQETNVKTEINNQQVSGVTELSGNRLKIKITYSDAEPGKPGEIKTIAIPSGYNNKDAVNKIADQLFNSRMKDVELEIEGEFKFRDSIYKVTENALRDSIVKLKSDSTHFSKKETTIEVYKERKGVAIGWQLILWLLFAAIVLLFFFIKRNWIYKIYTKIKSIFKT